MKNFKWLQLFAEGEGEGSAPAPSSEATGTGVTEGMTQEQSAFRSRLPERAQETFDKSFAKTHKNTPPTEVAPQETEAPQRTPLSELLKDETYKAEYQEMINKALQSRFKKYDGLEERANKMSKTLNTVAQKYGIDPNTENFYDVLESKVNDDTSYWEDAASEYGMTPEAYKKMVETEQRAKEAEIRAQETQRAEAQRRSAQKLLAQAEVTKQKYKDFNLDAEMQNEEFKRLLFAYNGDTTAAYESLYRERLQEEAIKNATNKAKQAIANSIASGQSRPVENGASKTTSAAIAGTPSFKGMSTEQMREWYAQRRH